MRPFVLPLVALALVSLSLTTGCKKPKPPLDALQWTGETLDDRARPFRHVSALGGGHVETPAEPGAELTAWLGVRHDLMLSIGTREPSCTCLAVDVGAPTSPVFFWTNGAPEIGPNALALAITARGVSCPGGPADEAARRPSIAGVEQVNDDIIIDVEDLHEGAPLAFGAIIPRPKAGGSIFVRPTTPKSVYGRSRSERACKIR